MHSDQITVITSFSREGYEQYGRTAVRSFCYYWPDSVKLLCAWEGPDFQHLSGFDLLETYPCKEFLARHANNDVVQGRKEGSAPWKQKARDHRYSWRHDAYKFARKVFAIAAAARYVEGGKLFWIDADTRTNKAIPIDLLHRLLPDDVAISYLSRGEYHSECGFVGYNLDHKDTRGFIAAFEQLYASDLFMDLREWHDSYVFDWLMNKLKPKCYHIPHSDRRQPFDNSPLGEFMTHLKGPRKLAA